ncbi:MAG: DNA cytosine methyltransferase [Lacipirellulaceae bacterium]
MTEARRRTVVSLFSGAGGLDLGLEQAGWRTVAATDFDADCVRTLLHNQARGVAVEGSCATFLDGAQVVREDVAELSADQLRPGSRLPIDLLVGGPPCQPFSSSGKQLGVFETRGRLFEHFVRIAEGLRPRAILFENVRGLVTARGESGEPGDVVAQIRAAFHAIGYATSFAVLNAGDFGAPQRRVRLFMIGTRDVDAPAFPPPTHAKVAMSDLFGGTKPWVTLGEFLKSRPKPRPEDCERPSEALAELLRDVPEGSGVKSPGRPEPTRPGGHWGYRQGTFVADRSQPARTVTATASQDWVRDSAGRLRRLTLGECAALQGFPDEWEFLGARASRFRQVGNAVPAVFGRALGQTIAEALEGPKRRKPTARDLPSTMAAAVEYTKRDHARNAVARPRTNAFLVGSTALSATR